MNRFFVCVNGNPVEVPCGPGLHFNEAIRQCDLPERANCRANGGNGNRLPSLPRFLAQITNNNV